MDGGSRRRYALRHPELDRAVEELVERVQQEYGATQGAEHVRQILVTALRLAGEQVATGDLKLINESLKELRHSFRVFAPYRRARKVACFGSARIKEGDASWRQAFDFARRIAAEGWMVITGGGGGIMEAAQRGAGAASSFGVNIRLPFEQRPNDEIAGDPKLINFRYFFTRKVTFVKESHAIALFPGGFGTHDEGFEALTLIQTGKGEILPVVFLDEPGGSYWRDWERYVVTHLRDRAMISDEDLSLFLVTDDVEEAVAEIRDFYRNYHSSRFVGDKLVIRMRRAPDAEELDRLNESYTDILSGGSIVVTGPLEREGGEAEALPRIVLRFNRRDMGRLRELIDQLNGLAPTPEAEVPDASPHEIFEVPLVAGVDPPEGYES